MVDTLTTSMLLSPLVQVHTSFFMGVTRAQGGFAARVQVNACFSEHLVCLSKFLPILTYRSGTPKMQVESTLLPMKDKIS